MSLWIDCDNNDELERLFDRLADGGEVFMPLADYGFSTRWMGRRSLWRDLAIQPGLTTNTDTRLAPRA